MQKDKGVLPMFVHKTEYSVCHKNIDFETERKILARLCI